MPRYRVTAEDFRVEELPLYPPAQDGPFLWLWIEKRGRDTDEVARLIARAFDLPAREVGWAGRKDRHAVTRQAFTLPARCEPRLGELTFDGVRLLDVRRSGERLRTGQLRGNRFELLVREVASGEAETAATRAGELERRGLPNRFGAQRYGHGGRNVERGRRILAGERIRGERRRAFLMVAALQSRVFDEVLRRRPYDRLLAGDLALDHATGDWRWIDDPAAHHEAVGRFELSPTGPIFGTKTKRARGAVAELESQVMRQLGVPPVAELEPPKGLRLYGDRRALRVRPAGLELRHRPEDDALELSFELPAGSYATVLLEELFPGGLEQGPSTQARQGPHD